MCVFVCERRERKGEREWWRKAKKCGDKCRESAWTKDRVTEYKDDHIRIWIQILGFSWLLKSSWSQVSTIMCHQWWHKVTEQDRWGQQQCSPSLSTCTIKQSHSAQKGLTVIWVENGLCSDMNIYRAFTQDFPVHDETLSIQLDEQSQYLHRHIQLMIIYFT